ncbi:hypothetical protein BH18THE1_BH18THE1_19500 [soil metagenome]
MMKSKRELAKGNIILNINQSKMKKICSFEIINKALFMSTKLVIEYILE